MTRGFTLWCTGLSGAGKTTLTNALVPQLRDRGVKIEVLDGDEVRTNLSKGLGFSKEDRDVNIRRIGYVSRLLARNGVGVIAAAISPYREIRDEVRRLVEADGAAFVEVFVKASIDALVTRDVKGLYKKALAGEIKQFTGGSDPYEEPFEPELVVETDRETIAESAAKILARLEELNLIASARRCSDGGAAAGGPGLLTLKARDLIAEAGCVIYDYLVNPEILEHASAGAELIYVGQRGLHRYT